MPASAGHLVCVEILRSQDFVVLIYDSGNVQMLYVSTPPTTAASVFINHDELL
jgi:hypothetical protein